MVELVAMSRRSTCQVVLPGEELESSSPNVPPLVTAPPKAHSNSPITEFMRMAAFAGTTAPSAGTRLGTSTSSREPQAAVMATRARALARTAVRAARVRVVMEMGTGRLKRSG